MTSVFFLLGCVVCYVAGVWCGRKTYLWRMHTYPLYRERMHYSRNRFNARRKSFTRRSLRTIRRRTSLVKLVDQSESLRRILADFDSDV